MTSIFSVLSSYTSTSVYFSSYSSTSEQVIFDIWKCFRKRKTEQYVSIGIKFNHERELLRKISLPEKKKLLITQEKKC